MEVYSGRKLRLISKHFCILMTYVQTSFQVNILNRRAFMTMCLHYYVLLYWMVLYEVGIHWKLRPHLRSQHLRHTLTRLKLYDCSHD